MASFQLWQCPACGHAQFPQRHRCTRCTGGPLRAVAVAPQAVVEDATVLHRAFGLPAGQQRFLATVRHASGARVVVRSAQPLPVGSAVHLVQHDDGAIWASLDDAAAASGQAEAA